jgi:hypothetical protein
VPVACLYRAARDAAGTRPQSESSVGRFLLGFIVAIILVVYVAARCVGAIT